LVNFDYIGHAHMPQVSFVVEKVWTDSDKFSLSLTEKGQPGQVNLIILASRFDNLISVASSILSKPRSEKRQHLPLSSSTNYVQLR
jgi:hypothetical protein